MRTVAIAVFCSLLGFGCVTMAFADPPMLPPDPLTDPSAAFNSFQALYKISWPLAVIAGVAVIARLLGRFAPKLSFLAGRPAAVVAVVAACSAAAFDVLALGGSWASVVVAAVTSLLTLWQPTPVKAEGGK
jgi:hypothetical protein